MKGGQRCLWSWLALLQPVAVSSLVMTSVSQVIYRLQHHRDFCFPGESSACMHMFEYRRFQCIVVLLMILRAVVNCVGGFVQGV